MNVVFLGLGGNIGDRLENLRKTIAAIEINCGEIIKVSGIYETEAWGSDSKNKYLNQVIEIQTALSVQGLIEKLFVIEKQMGRTRSNVQNSDRTADIDILLYNNLILNSELVHVPHPRLHLRKFVLVPLSEIASEVIHPVLKKTIGELLKNSSDKLEVKKTGSQ